MRRAPGRLRIIGGTFRSRLIDFDAEAGVRPTPDRVRQTLFDWLAPVVEGSRVLDLYAGSGALGFEALSRGAREAVFVERGRVQLAAIRAAIAHLGVGTRSRVVDGDAIAFVALEAARGTCFDIVFVDPPYGADLLAPTLEQLPAVLAPGARIYIEWPSGKPPALPPGYAQLREKEAGQVSYGLFTYAPPGDPQQ